MKYRLRNNYPKEPELAIQAILEDRGVKDVEEFMRPNRSQELNPYDLENIEAAAQMLLKHLRNNSEIMFVVDWHKNRSPR